MISVLPSTTQATGTCLKILLVEDNNADRQHVEQLLLESQTVRSLSVTSVARLSEAIACLGQQSFDIVLLDLSLPDSQGFDTVIKLQEYGLHVPIVVLTANTDEELALQTIQAGVQDYLVKRELTSHHLIHCLRCALERHKRQTAGQLSEEKYRFVIDNIKEVIFQTDIAGNWTFLNAAWTEIMGFGVAETLETSCFKYVVPSDRPQAQEHFYSLINREKNSCRYTIRYQTKSQDICWFEVQVRLTFALDGTLTGTTGTLNDITDRVMAQQQLQASQEFLSQILNAVADPIFVKDKQHRWIMVNDAFCNFLNQRRETLIGRSDYNFFPPEEAEIFWGKDEQVFQTGRDNENEESLTRPDGDLRIVYTQKRLVQMTDGQQMLVGTIRDITHYKHQQAELQEMAAIQQAILNSTHYAIISTNEAGVILTFNLAAEQMLGYKAVELIEVENITILHDPEEIFCRANELCERTGQAIESNFDVFTLNARRGKIEEREWTYIRKDGSRFPVFLSVTALKDRGGSITGFLGIARDITQQKQAEAALKVSQRFVQQVASSSPDILYVLDFEERRNIYTNDSLKLVLGYEPAVIQEMGPQALQNLMHPEDFVHLANYFQQIAIGADGEFFEIEYRIRHRDGSWRWLMSRDTIFARTPEGRVKQILGTATDITDRKQAELEIRLLLSTTQAIGQAENFQEALAVILRLLCTAIGWHYAEVWTPSLEGTVLTCGSGWYASDRALASFGQQSQQLTFASGVGLLGRIWESGQLEWITDLNSIEESVFPRAQSATAAGLKTCFGFPIVANKQVLAILVFFNRTIATQEPRLTELLKVVATQLSWHIQRKQAEAALRQSEERFRSLVENIPGAIYQCVYTTHWTVEFMSEEIETISGYASRQFLHDRPLSFSSFVVPEDADRVQRQIAEAIATRQPYSVEYRTIDARGKTRWISETGRAAYGADGTARRLDGAIFDISDRKQAELALLQITQAVESASDAIGITDWDGYSLYHNRAFIERYGYTVNELNERGGPKVMYVKPQILTRIFKTLRKGKSWTGKVAMKTKTGEILQTQVRADCIKDKAGHFIGMIAVITDITQLKQTESALRLSEERLQLALSSSALGLWDWKLGTGEMYFDPQWKRMLGYEIDEIEHNYKTWERLIYPEDKGKVLEALQAYLHGDTERYETEFRMLSKDGIWKWVLASGKTVEFDESDRPVRMTGTHKDISDRKQAEAEKTQLITSLQELTRQLQDAQRIAHIGNWEVEVATRTITCSAEVSRIWGWEVDRVQTLEQIEQQIHPDDRDSWQRRVQQAIDRGLAYDLDLRIYLLNGNLRYVNIKGKAVRNEAGQAVRLFGTAMDISDRKLAEAALKESEQRFRAIFERAAIGITQVWPDGQFLKVNPGFCKIVGYSATELQQKTYPDLTHPDDLETDGERARQLLTGEIQSYAIEKRFIRKDGEPIWTNLTVSLVRDASGEPMYGIAVVEDISQRKQAQEALQQQLRRERLVGIILERIRSSLNLEEVLTTTVAEVRQFLQTDRTVIYRFYANWSGQIVVESVKDGWMPLISRNVQDRCFAEVLVPYYQKGHVGTIANTDAEGLEECHRQFLKELQVQAMLAVPILQNEKLWGLLIAHHCTAPREWEEAEIHCLKQICVQLAIALQQSMLFEQAKTEIAERRQAIVALRESEARERSKALQLEVALHKLRNTQAQLVQNEKMVSLGQLVAGVAHEINNPVNFISGNLKPACDYSSDLLQLIELYQSNYPQPNPEISRFMSEIDLDYISQDLPQLFNSMKVGTERIREIVKSLRTFSRLDEAEMKQIDIHEGIDSTLMILQSRLKPSDRNSEILLEKNYGQLPKMECYAGQLNQVFMNILSNAIDALEDSKPTEGDLQMAMAKRIRICTYLADSERVVISIEDNGKGVSESVRPRLFDPFFTTKPVGKGTGLGLSIAHSIVVERHGGNLTCVSTPGQGAKFIIEIPVKPCRKSSV